MPDFKLVSDYKPMGDQIDAIKKLTKGINDKRKGQTLLGVTGSGKTFTIANVIANVNKPTLVLAHNKILAAQLCSEFKEFFPENAVEYFVSYYDYYQPEAYIPNTDTYIEKDSSINDEIDKLRHSATSALFERRDVIVVSSVSCIYSLGDPKDYAKLILSLRTGMELDRDEVIRKLVDIQSKYSTALLGKNSLNSLQSCAARILLCASTSVGLLVLAIKLAIVNVFPEPVTPIRVCSLSPCKTPRASASIALG